jgi:hypothetical protein
MRQTIKLTECTTDLDIQLHVLNQFVAALFTLREMFGNKARLFH